MRRRRQTLQVSTFPFLAVLLCAMGALILVLLVMDRKAKMGARARAEQEAAHQAEEAAAARRAAWEQKRTALHATLTAQEQDLQGRLAKLREDITTAALRLRAEQEKETSLRQKIELERGRVAGVEQTLAAQRAATTQADTESVAAQGTLAKMTADLLQLEQALKDLKAAREREKQTYSVVPYHGKRGENRRPLYVECAASGLVFHPEHLSMSATEDPAKVRAEVERRIAQQKERLKGAQPADQPPYLMLLVRPDGIASYYQLQTALKGVTIDFGYEFIDPQWVLDFPENEDQQLAQPWMTAAKPATRPMNSTPGAKPGTPLVGLKPSSGTTTTQVIGRSPGLVADSSGSPSANPGGGTALLPGSSGGSGSGSVRGERSGSAERGPGLGDGSAGREGIGLPGLGGHPAALPPTTDSGGDRSLTFGNPAGPGSGSANHGPAVAAGGGPPLGDRSAVGGDSGGGHPAVLSSPTRPLLGPGGGVVTSGTLTPGRPGGGTPRTNLGSSSAPLDAGPDARVWLAPQGGVGTGAGHEPGSPASSQPGSAAPLPAGTNGVPVASTSTGTQQPGIQAPPLVTGVADSIGNSDLPPRLPEESAAAVKDPRKPVAIAGNGGASGEMNPEDQALARITPATPQPPAGAPRRPVALRPARLQGDRDWVIFIECQPDAVILYPSHRVFPLTTVSRFPANNNPLLLAVQQLIDRRQASVPPGHSPYRPEIRFLVRPDSTRTFHVAYPAVEALQVPKRRQNLEAEDDVFTIMASP
jgi:hypothetical protein